MLSRLMTKLGAKEEQAKAVEVAAAQPATVATPPPTARARLLQGPPGTGLQVDDGFDRAWRRVGLALDRSGFTVEDRDRAQGLYFVRYIDPKAAKAEPGFFAKLFSDKVFGHAQCAGALPHRTEEPGRLHGRHGAQCARRTRDRRR